MEFGNFDLTDTDAAEDQETDFNDPDAAFKAIEQGEEQNILDLMKQSDDETMKTMDDGMAFKPFRL